MTVLAQLLIAAAPAGHTHDFADRRLPSRPARRRLIPAESFWKRVEPGWKTAISGEACLNGAATSVRSPSSAR
jgi:hypothetical protein